MEENDLIRMLSLISKFLTPWTGTKTTTIHILPKCANCAGEASPSPFHKKTEMSISLDVVPPSPHLDPLSKGGGLTSSNLAIRVGIKHFF